MDTAITFNLPEHLDKRLKEMAKRKLVSKSALIRIILSDHVEAQSHESAQTQPEEATA